jgi:hypothetical protein
MMREVNHARWHQQEEGSKKNLHIDRGPITARRVTPHQSGK